MRRTLCSLLVVGVLAALLPAPAASCSFGFGVLFWTHHVPGPEVTDFLAGDLGILAPVSRGRGSSPLFEVVAWRYLSGADLDAQEQAALIGLLAPRWRQAGESLAAWEFARRAHAVPRSYPGVVPDQRVQREYRSAGGAPVVYYRRLRNCVDDAFDTALRTLEDRRERYDAAELAEWLRGQDRVFFACRGSGPLPEPPAESWSALLRADRVYQIAATHFYLRQYDEALALFGEIASDRDSPWRPISAYLVARTMFRRASGDDMAEARRTLEAVLADADLSEAHDSAELLLGHFLARQQPIERRRELAAELAVSRLSSSSKQKLIDYGLLLERTGEGEGADEELTEWIRALRAGSTEVRLAAAERWSRRRTVPWLVAASASALGGDPRVSEILAAIEDLPASSPAHSTLGYHHARLLAEQGEYDRSRRLGDRLLEASELSLSDRNRLLALQARYAPDLQTYLDYAPMRAVRIGITDGGRGSIPQGREGDGFDVYREQRLLFGDEALFAMNHYLTPAMLLEAARRESLPPTLRLQMARSAWVRAFVVDDDAVAADAARLLIDLEEKPRRTGLRLYLAARPGEDRQFAAAFYMLRHPEMTPAFHRLKSPYTVRLWCPGWPSHTLYSREAGAPAPPSFLSEGQLADAATLTAAFEGLESGQKILGRIVIGRAETQPGDDRLPEALHLVVRATRRACGGESQKEISQPAFRLLHELYPESPWAAKTPYWFD